ncbi:bacterio-opsin activator-like transcription regulator [Halorubrum californiense DSM 19288]|uniref:Bacterio-opsin activator-like transcription regulator n=1 Tax=Halorubrum californiense DSM 19288 TaxID=1227465 RepID=M0E649_9EURY|nr:bacterio-opsin activator-like transcription regulator [Halorubrum californiense DSM 19288]
MLCVDGDPEETQRVAAALQGEPEPFHVVTETDPVEALDRLSSGDIDCLVAGYDLPTMDGVTFLESVRETHGDVPFILFTGSGSEAVASRAISAGVTDYVRSRPGGGGLDALVDRIRALLSHDGAATEWAYDEAQFERFVEAFPDVVFAINEEGRYVDVIAGGTDSLLFDDPEELLGSRFHDLLPVETADRSLDAIQSTLETGEQQRIEYQLEVQSGTRWFEGRVGPLDASGSTQTVFWIARDITARKRREQEYEQIFNSVNDAITVFDPKAGEITEINEAYREMLGYDIERIRELGIDGLSATDEGYTGEQAWELIRDVAETGESKTVEWRAKQRNGDRIWLEATLTPAEIGGERRVLSIQRDVTDRRELERTYRSVFENVSDGLVVHDPETGEITDVNDRFSSMNGYDREQLMGETIDVVTGPDHDYERAKKMVEQAREGESQLFEWRNERADGTTFPVEVNLSVIDLRGEERVLASVRDITARKRREREYEQIFDGVNDAIVIQDPETGEPVDANETFLDRLGYDNVDEIREEGLAGLSATQTGHTKEYAEELCHRVIETGESEVVEWAQETKDGERRWIEATVDSAVIQGEDRILSMQRDITERKRRQRIIQKLHASTNDLQEAESIEDVCEATVAAAEEVLNISMPICWIHGYDEPDVLSPVATSETVWDASQGVDGPGEFEPGDFQYEVYETGEMRIYDPSERREETPLNCGVLIGLGDHGMFGAADPGVETFDDVTLDAARILARHARAALDRVERERELRESERRFRLIAEQIDEVIYLANTDFTEVLYVNPAYETIWGRSTEELYDDAQNFLEAVDPRDREEIKSDVETMVAEMQRDDPADSYDFEYRIRQPGGEIRWVSATGYTIEMSGDERRFVAIVEDVTERKYREQRLEVFNRILRHNLRNQLDVIRSHAEALIDQIDNSHPKQIVAAVDELAAMGARARNTDQIIPIGEATSEVELPETMMELADELAPNQGTVEVVTDLPASARLMNNDEALRTAVRSALENAIEYADSTVRLTVQDSPDGYVVIIDDDGPGIPEEELIPIEAGTETKLNHGRGLGLWQLRWAVDKLNGELSFDTNDGTTIRIGVPDRDETARSN